MKVISPTAVLLLLLLHGVSRTAYSQSGSSAECSKQDYDLCVKMADPLLKDARLIFPDNTADIDHVCWRWNQFVDCVKRYTNRCFTESRRQEFNKAVESPVDSVHQMCTDTKYQTEYLKHASCIKSTLTREEHCGKHYRHLVDQVSGEANRVGLCCSHLRFRECVLEETKRECDSGSNGGSAARFSRQILDKALSFLRDQCYNYIPTTGECPGLSVLSNPYNGHDESTSNSNSVPDQQHRPSNHQPYSPDVTAHPWHPQGTAGDRRGSNSPEVGGPSRPWLPGSSSGGGSSSGAGNSTGHQTSSARDNWTPGGDSSIPYTPPYEPSQSNKDHSKPSWLPGQSSDSSSGHSSFTPSDMASQSHATSTHTTMGQTPNRSSSYGRGITWTPSNTQSSNTWHVSSSPQHTTEPWFPAVSNYGGSYSGNAVDEPNQQGLSNNNNNKNNEARKNTVNSLMFVATLTVIFISSDT